MYRSILLLLDPVERRRFHLLIGVSVLMALMDVLGVAAIMPLLAVIADPSLIARNDTLAAIHCALGAREVGVFLVQLSLLVFTLVVIGILCRAGAHYMLTRYSRMRAYSIGRRLFRCYLARDYAWYLSRNTADLARTVLDEVREVVNGPVSSAMSLVANTVVTALLVGLLLIVEPVAALTAASLLAGCYGAVFLFARRRAVQLGEHWQAHNRERHHIMQEALSGIREVKLFDLEERYLHRYSKPAREVAHTIARINILTELPRYLLEAVGFGGMLIFLLVLLVRHDGQLSTILPVLGVYAVAGVRLFPLVQQVYASYTVVRSGQPMMAAMAAELVASPVAETQTPAQPVSPLRHAIELDRVRYWYPGADRPALSCVSLRIECGRTVGLVGVTGSGKSTLVDLLMGLLRPQEGELRVDGRVIDARQAAGWRARVGYVPQSLFLLDGTIADNIAFGHDADEADRARVADAARLAQLDTFLDGLPAGLDTPVGERGARLSGGQRQRIAIARALYRDPDLLILDEATSALDGATEDAILAAVRGFAAGRTVVMITHRLTTLRHCDAVHVLEDGRIAASGSYARIGATHPAFATTYQGEC